MHLRIQLSIGFNVFSVKSRYGNRHTEWERLVEDDTPIIHPTNKTPGKRTLKLAKPRIDLAKYLQEYGLKPHLNIDNQDPIWPIPKSALTYRATARIRQLAKPKSIQSKPRNLYLDAEGKPTPVRKIKILPKNYKPSVRTIRLARPIIRPVYHDKTMEEIMTIKPAVLKLTKVSKRLEELSKPRNIVCETEIECWKRKMNQLLANRRVTHRTDELANPPLRYLKHPVPVEAISRTRLKSAAKHDTTERDRSLGQARKLHAEYVRNRRPSDINKVKQITLKYRASERINELAQNKTVHIGAMEREYNPDALKISEAAKKAKLSARIADLAKPKQYT